jgi:hypothetical protein
MRTRPAGSPVSSRGIFSFDGHKLEVAVNWGLAAAIYYAIATLIARFAARR